MKLTNNTLDLELHNTGEQGAFTIKSSAKAFLILSSGLYSDKIRAVIRELACNANDSHKLANKMDVPFTIHLPNKIEPHFSVRDYGVGLCHEDVMNLYTTYFESTKTDSNDYIGALGLGSKSPFAYTSNFTVTSWFAGTKTIYSAVINAEGKPDIIVMASEDYDESTISTGIEVQFPVIDSDDYYQFRNKASGVLQWFETEPEVVGDSSFSIYQESYKHRDLTPGTHLQSHGRSPIAVQGCISYPIDYKKIPAFEKYQHLFSFPFEFHFEIGELDIAASREELSYIPQTIEAIKARFRIIDDALLPLVEEKIKPCATPWEKGICLSGLLHDDLLKTAAVRYSKNNDYDGLLTVASAPNPYQGGSTQHSIVRQSLNKEVAEEMGFSVVKMEASGRYGRTVVKLKKTILDVEENTDVFRFRPSDDIRFLIIDSKKPFATRLNTKYGRIRGAEIYVIGVLDGHSVDSVRAELDKKYGQPPIEFVSDLPPPAPRQSNGYAKGILCLTKRDDYYRKADYVFENIYQSTLDTVSEDLKYYVPMTGFDIHGPVTKKSDLLNFLEYCQNIGIREDDIYGVRQNGLANVLADPTWINLFDHYREQFNKMHDNVGHRLMSSSLSSTVFSKSVFEDFSELDEDTLAYKFLSKYEDIWQYSASSESYMSNYRKVAEAYDIKYDFYKFRNDADNEIEKMLMRYPLLRFIDPARTDSPRFRAKNIIQYMKLIDQGDTE